MDSTPDISHKEQFSIVIRTVIIDSDEEPSIKEYILNFIEVKPTTGLNLSSVLIKELSENGLQFSNCRDKRMTMEPIWLVSKREFKQEY